MTTVGLLHPGNMGAQVGAVLRAAGHDVAWVRAGRSVQTLRRAQDADLRPVTATKTLAGESRIVLSICDQGIGITPDEQRHLGFRSFRGERHQTSIPGSGLGFWIASTFVQAHGGILVEQLKKRLHLDLREGDRMFWFTTTGWMMWNFLVGVLLTDASIVLYDGNPGYPDMGRLWDLAEETGMTTFGTSAAFVSGCMKEGITLRDSGRSLASLTAVGSTGSPLSPEGFRWVYDELGEDEKDYYRLGGAGVSPAGRGPGQEADL